MTGLVYFPSFRAQAKGDHSSQLGLSVSVEINWGCMEWFYPNIVAIGVYRYAPLPLAWMAQRIAGVLIRVLTLIGKTNFFSESPISFLCCFI